MSGKYLSVYGLYAGFALFVIAAWTSAAALSDGAIPGANGASAWHTVPMTFGAALLAVTCLSRLVRGAR